MAILAPMPPAPPPAHVRTVACTLELHGSLNTRRRGPKGPETVSETFHATLPGWLEEAESEAGSVTFTFTADPGRPAFGTLDQRVRGEGRRPPEQVHFQGTHIPTAGPFRFSAALRGQNLYPSGALSFTGRALVQDGRGWHEELTTRGFTPFPDIRQGPADHAAPTLRFATSTLWRLQRTSAPFMVRGSVTYRNSSQGASHAGRVETVFKLDPRASR